MGCLSGLAKYLLFFFNFLIVVCGIVLIAIGAIILVNENKGIDSFTSFSIGGFAIGVGVIIFAIAFFGCCGAIKENGCMLTTYAVILIVLLVLQVVLGALAFVALRNDDSKLDDAVKDVVQRVFNDYRNHTDNDDKRKVIDTIQQDFKCCGVNSPKDWPDWGLSINDTIVGIPFSCFKDKDVKKDMYEKGCASQFKAIITDNVKIIGGVAIGFAAVELLGAIFACVVKNRK